MKQTQHYSCSYCGNDWTIEQGFNLKTNQCPPCDEFDVEEPLRKKERERLIKYWEEEGCFVETNLAFKYGRKF